MGRDEGGLGSGRREGGVEVASVWLSRIHAGMSGAGNMGAAAHEQSGSRMGKARSVSDRQLGSSRWGTTPPGYNK